jgi:hypothetical protein
MAFDLDDEELRATREAKGLGQIGENEEIKILEDLINRFALVTVNGEEYKIPPLKPNEILAIENLIKRNKELEEIEQEHKKENGELRGKVKELEEKCKKDSIVIIEYQDILENNIPKSVIKEKIEELEKTKSRHYTENWADWKDDEVYQYIIQVLEELLEDK